MSYYDSLHNKITNKSITVGVIGLGYVGLPLALSFASRSIHVLGFDIDENKVSAINNGRSYISHISNHSITNVLTTLSATSDLSLINRCELIILCLPTPIDAYNIPDLSFITQTMKKILPYLVKGQLLILESTTYPGTTRESIIKPIEDNNFNVGENFFVCYSPEREDPGNSHFNTQNIPKVIAGKSNNCLNLGKQAYQLAIDKLIPVSSLETAEMTKLTENIQRAVNIGLMNELKIIADKMNIDIFEVINAAATKPFGFTPYFPGPGLGGHCLPIDPFYLTYKAKEFGVDSQFIELAGKINRSMPAWVVNKIVDALNEQEKSIKGSKILILGLAYKKNINDTRESPAIEILSLLNSKGAKVAYSDPYVPTFPKVRRYSFELESTPLTAVSISKYDCVVLATDHDDFDYKLLLEHANLIVDPRGRLLNQGLNIVSA